MPNAPDFLIGTGISDITDSTPGLGMQGFANELQKVADVSMPLYSRSFVIAKNNGEEHTRERTAIVIADLWSCTQAIKTEVVNRLNGRNETDPHAHTQVPEEMKGLYTTENVLISGTHTHSGPGGYSKYFLYHFISGGFDKKNFNIIVDGIVSSILKAHTNLAPGRIYMNKGKVQDCGYNRSIIAYNNNNDKDNFAEATDKEMLLLRFVKTDVNNENSYDIGVLSWYGIHPTSLGQSNTSISGDNKGWASKRFEEIKRTNYDPNLPEIFIAAFANSCAGDVSGSIRSDYSRIEHDNTSDIINMKNLGNKQFELAKDLFDSNTFDELTGNIDYRYTHIDMAENLNGSPNQTWPAALGISFGAGSSEDGDANIYLDKLFLNVPSPIEEGVTKEILIQQQIFTIPIFLSNISGLSIEAIKTFEDVSNAVLGIESEPGVRFEFLKKLLQSLQLPSLSAIAFLGLRGKLENYRIPNNLAWELPILDPFDFDGFQKGHSSKPIMLPVGISNPYPLVPNVVPIQLLRIGRLVISGVPGEITTMSGRRLKKTIYSAFGNDIYDIAIAAYSNAYSGYITTEEEYNMQHYEGASTLYGPKTLARYQEEYIKLAQKIVAGETVEPKVPAYVEFYTLKTRLRGILPTQLYVNNRTGSDAKIKIYNEEDPGKEFYSIPLNALNNVVHANTNLLIGGLTKTLSYNVQVKINGVTKTSVHKGGQIIKIYNEGEQIVVA